MGETGAEDRVEDADGAAGKQLLGPRARMRTEPRELGREQGRGEIAQQPGPKAGARIQAPALLHPAARRFARLGVGAHELVHPGAHREAAAHLFRPLATFARHQEATQLQLGIPVRAADCYCLTDAFAIERVSAEADADYPPPLAAGLDRAGPRANGGWEGSSLMRAPWKVPSRGGMLDIDGST
jgi:hypothetical protein